MELKLKPAKVNAFPLNGMLIRGALASAWILEIQTLDLYFSDIEIFPVPGTAANTIWGCFVLSRDKLNPHNAGRNELCQQVSANLFIPERTILDPALLPAELEKLFAADPHIIHPEFGLVKLNEKLNSGELLLKSTERSYYVTKPEAAVFIPTRIKNFQVKSAQPENIIKNLEENIFPKKEEIAKTSLNIFEKGKLLFYKLLFTENKEKSDAYAPVANTGFFSKFLSIVNFFTKKPIDVERFREDFTDLEKRNQRQIDKLMEMFKNDPAEALKYAIPLDNTGTIRGGESSFNLSKRWFDFSLFGNDTSSRSGNVSLGDHYYELQKQYHETVAAFIQQREYIKAAFIYMKLLKNDQLAAQTLESGLYYQEAAAVYLKLGNKKKAAECFEKGNMISQAIQIYKDLDENEKVGDLYLSIHNKKEAEIYFNKVTEDYTSRKQFVKASLVYKNKLNNITEAKSLLLEGWKLNNDSFNCLNNYFSNITNIKELKREIDSIFSNDISEHNREVFLRVIKYEYTKNNELAASLKEMAYQLVADQIPFNPAIVSELKEFNKNNKELIKDAIRFKLNNKKSS